MRVTAECKTCKVSKFAGIPALEEGGVGGAPASHASHWLRR